MAIEFFDVKTRTKVSVDESQVKKVVYEPKGSGGKRYAVRAQYEGRNLTKFISEEAYKNLAVPEG